MPMLPLLASIALAEPAAAAEGSTYLAAIQGLRVGAREYVESFEIATWGVEILAVCRIPPGWRVTAGNSAAPDGIIAGEATHGVTFLDASRVSALEGIVLVRLAGAVQREARAVEHGTVPATFAGRASVGSYAGAEGREVPLTYANVRLTRAAGCPALP
jgi:hypothetical protein